MSRMTVVAGSVMALGVAYVGSSWLLGHVAQQKYQTEFERVARLLGADSVEMVEVEKGLFHSRTMTVLTFERRSPASGADDAEVAEVQLVECAGQCGCVVGDAEEGEPLRLCRRGHLTDSAVGVHARQCMRVDVDDVGHGRPF